MSYYRTDLEQEFGPSAANTNPNPFFGGVGDIAQGAMYGVAESAHSVWNLLDSMTFDMLPDWDEQTIIEAPTSTLGAMAGGITQFVVPYMGVTGAIGMASKAALSLKFPGGVVRALNYLDGNQATSIARSVQAARLKGNGTLGMAHMAMGAAAGNMGRSVLKGAVTDFVAFEGSDERLSNLIEKEPSLANPITAFLAADEEDSEMLGRLKNVLEGAALGFATDAVLDSIRAVRVRNKILNAGGTREEAAQAMLNKLDDSYQSRRAQESLEDKIVFRNEEEKTFSFVSAGGDVVEATGSELDGLTESIVKSLDEELHERLAAKVPENSGDFSDLPEPGSPGFEQDKVDLGGYDEITPEDLDKADYVGSATRYIPETRDVRPRSALKRELEARGLERYEENLSMMTGDDGFSSRLIRALNDYEPPSRPVGEKQINALAEAIAGSRDLAGKKQQEFQRALVDLAASSKDVYNAGVKVFMWRVYAERFAQELAPYLDALSRNPNVTTDQFAKVASYVKHYDGIRQGVRDVYSEFGLGLSRAGIEIDEDVIGQTMQDVETLSPVAVMAKMADDPESADPERMKALIDELATLLGSEHVDDNMKALEEWQQSSRMKKGMAAVQEYHINSLLSGISTHAVNVTSGVIMSFWQPIEGMLGAGLERAIAAGTGDTVRAEAASKLLRKEFGTISALFGEFTEAYRLVKQSNGSDGWASLSMLEGRFVSPLDQTLGKTMFSPLVHAIKFPTKALEMEDRFFKIWNGRARARAHLTAEWSGRIEPSMLGERVTESLNQMAKVRGDIKQRAMVAKQLQLEAEDRAVLQGMDPEGVDGAKWTEAELDDMMEAKAEGVLQGQRATFTQKRDEGLFGSLADAANLLRNRHPLAKFFIPFVNTPTNIVDYGWDRTAGGVLAAAGESLRFTAKQIGIPMDESTARFSRIQRELMSSDMQVRARARAKVAFGFGAVGTVAYMTSLPPDEEGMPMITGSEPSNYNVAKSLKEAGWQPYSIRIGGTYVSYARLDPIATLLGAVVDASRYIQENADEQSTATQYAQAIMMSSAVSIGNNLTSKTYLKGLTDVLSFAMDPDRNAEHLAGSLIQTAVPSISGAFARAIDPEIREKRDIADRLIARIPGWSKTLPTQRNILGEPIKMDHQAWAAFLPTRFSRVKDKIVDRELAQFAYGFSVPETTKGGMDLLDEQYNIGDQAAYDRWTELSGKVRIGGLDLRQRLRKLIQSSSYQKLTPDDDENGNRSPRIPLIKREIRRYRERAWKQILQEQPRLRSDIRKRTQTLKARREGRLGF